MKKTITPNVPSSAANSAEMLKEAWQEVGARFERFCLTAGIASLSEMMEQDAGAELALPSWETSQREDWLGRWAVNLMLINVSTRKFRRAVRLAEGDVRRPKAPGFPSRPRRAVSWR